MTQPDRHPNVEVFPDVRSVARKAAALFAELATAAIAERGTFRVALSGGSTPKALYAVLAERPYRDDVAWAQIQIFFSDERFVPPGSEESNFHTAEVGLLSRVAIPDASVYRVPTVDISPERAASDYEGDIRRAFGTEAGAIPDFDLVFLGMGPDGHTASLFPDTQALEETHRLVAPNFVPKLDAWRITFTYALLNAARCACFLVAGEDKGPALSAVLTRESALPAALVRPASGRVLWLVDQAAMSAAGSH